MGTVIEWIKRHSVSARDLAYLFDMVCCDPLWYTMSLWIIEQGHIDALVKPVLTSFMSPSVTVDPYDDRPELKQIDATLVKALMAKGWHPNQVVAGTLWNAWQYLTAYDLNTRKLIALADLFPVDLDSESLTHGLVCAMHACNPEMIQWWRDHGAVLTEKARD